MDDFSSILNRIEKELKASLPSSPDKAWLDSVFSLSSDVVNAKHAEPLIKPTGHLIALGGKRWRPLFLVLCTKAVLGIDDINSISLENAFKLTPLVEFVHTASLIHDDIEDASETRRGKPAAYITYGTDIAINAASWLYFLAPNCIDALDVSTGIKNSLYKMYLTETRKLHLGQAMDIDWHRKADFIPSIDEYYAMVTSKTGTLASMAARAGFICAGDCKNEEKAGRIASQIGAGFQIIDDVINLTTGNPGKKRGDDIVEGKKSLPVLIFAATGDYNKLRICFEKAKKDGIESSAVEEAIELLDKSNAISSAKKRGIELIEKGCAELQSLFPQKEAALDTLFMGLIPKEAQNA